MLRDQAEYPAPWEVRSKYTRDAYHHNWYDVVDYRWMYGSWLQKGFGMLQDHDHRGTIGKVRAFRNGWLAQVEEAASNFNFTGPFNRYCICHSLPMVDETVECPETRKAIRRWYVADSKFRVLGEADLDHGLIEVPNGVLYLMVPM